MKIYHDKQDRTWFQFKEGNKELLKPSQVFELIKSGYEYETINEVSLTDIKEELNKMKQNKPNKKQLKTIEFIRERKLINDTSHEFDIYRNWAEETQSILPFSIVLEEPFFINKEIENMYSLYLIEDNKYLIGSSTVYYYGFLIDHDDGYYHFIGVMASTEYEEEILETVEIELESIFGEIN